MIITNANRAKQSFQRNYRDDATVAVYGFGQEDFFPGEVVLVSVKPFGYFYEPQESDTQGPILIGVSERGGSAHGRSWAVVAGEIPHVLIKGEAGDLLIFEEGRLKAVANPGENRVLGHVVSAGKSTCTIFLIPREYHHES